MIRVADIEVVYGRGTDTEVRALHIESLEIHAGCWCNVIGPNGCGKSSLLRVLARQTALSRGRLFIDGQDVTKWQPRQLASRVQLLEQSPERNTIPSMTIEENLRLYSQNGRIPSLSFLARGSVARIKDLLKRFEMDLETRLSSQVGLLSGGQKQAVALAAVLLRHPKVLLLDEFLASIDPKASPKLLSVVREAAAERRITVLMVSHDLAHVEGTGDRLIILSEGQVADDMATAGCVIQRSQLVARYSAILERNGVL